MLPSLPAHGSLSRQRQGPRMHTLPGEAGPRSTPALASPGLARAPGIWPSPDSSGFLGRILKPSQTFISKTLHKGEKLCHGAASGSPVGPQSGPFNQEPWLLQGPLADGTGGRPWTRGAGAETTGEQSCFWICSGEPTPASSLPPRHGAAFSKQLSLVLGSTRASQSPTWGPRPPKRCSICGWMPNHSWCGMRPGASYSTISLAYPREIL